MSICDASSSWSGYQYQGKVSIYMVLKMINDFIENEECEEYKNYSIEIEKMEDFSIIHNGEYESIHQVKARAGDKTINPYLDAMGKLNEEKIKLPSLKLNLHTICNINDWSIEGYRKCLNTKIRNLSNSLKECKKENEKIRITKDIQYFNSLLSNESFFENIKLYKYPNKNYYCDLDEIEKIIIHEIKRYLILNDKEHKIGSVDIIYYQFIGFMDEYIKKRHEGVAKERIEFKEFKDRLDDDNILKRDENYYIYLTKERYIYNIHKYCEGICKNKGGCNIGLDNNDQKCKLVSVFELIKNTKLYDLKKIIFRINPHIEILDWERDNNELVSHLKAYFICNLVNHEIDYKCDISNNSISYRKDNKSYLPTTIVDIPDYLKPGMTEEYIKNLRNNELLLRDLFESNMFITGNIDKENILEDSYDVDEIDENKKIQDLEIQDKLYLRNRVDFKSIESTKKELV